MILMGQGEWTNADGTTYDVAKDIDAEMSELAKKAGPVVLKGALYYEGRIKELLTGERSGREYQVPGHPGIMYRASAPGEPPASPLGDLRKSITHTLPEWMGNEVFSEVGTSLVYGRILEYGGLTGRGHAVRILPRPYFAPSWLSAEDIINSILAEVVLS
jgi:phage gpG-like protein